MTKITRRGALGLGGAAFGLGACSKPASPIYTGEALEDARPPFAGEVTFGHGVASGDPLSDRVILWTRVTPEGEASGPVPVKWQVFSDQEMTKLVVTGFATADPARDYTVKVDVDRLMAGHEYFYAFTARTEAGEIASPSGRTKTLNADGEAPVKLAIISCAHWEFGFFNAYEALSRQEGLDAILHLGDYYYEYGLTEFSRESREALGRQHDPVIELVTRDDYRTRHAQYKSDPKLQAAHAAAPWLCMWDDHETANNSYSTGAQNHNPEEQEGAWTDRKQAAVEAYLEWMPVREPGPGRAREALYREFHFGDVATVLCLETRLTGRSEEISWSAELRNATAENLEGKTIETMLRVTDHSRTMLGAQQEVWLQGKLTKSVEAGKSWQVLANQTIMAEVKLPPLRTTLTPEQLAAQTGRFAQLVPLSDLALPYNLDAWDGFPAARQRLFSAAKEAGARLVTLTGDTHSAWANTLHDAGGEVRGVEFGCASITTPGIGAYAKDIPDLAQMFTDANEDVDFHDIDGHGFTLVTLTRDDVTADFVKVSTVYAPEFDVAEADKFKVRRIDDSIGKLRRAT